MPIRCVYMRERSFILLVCVRERERETERETERERERGREGEREREREKERKKKKIQPSADTPRLLIQEFHKSPGPVMRLLVHLRVGPAQRGRQDT